MGDGKEDDWGRKRGRTKSKGESKGRNGSEREGGIKKAEVGKEWK